MKFKKLICIFQVFFLQSLSLLAYQYSEYDGTPYVVHMPGYYSNQDPLNEKRHEVTPVLTWEQREVAEGRINPMTIGGHALLYGGCHCGCQDSECCQNSGNWQNNSQVSSSQQAKNSITETSKIIQSGGIKNKFELKKVGNDTQLVLDIPTNGPNKIKLNSLIIHDYGEIDKFSLNLPKHTAQDYRRHGISDEVMADLFFEFIGITEDGKKRVYRSAKIVPGCDLKKRPRNYYIDIFMDNRVDEDYSKKSKLNIVRTDVYDDKTTRRLIKAPGEKMEGSGLVIKGKNILRRFAEEWQEGYRHPRAGCSSERFRARFNAVNQVIRSKDIFDYSREVEHTEFTDEYAQAFKNCRGTHIDKQLHRELCQTRIIMSNLQNQYADNFHIRAFAPFVYRATGVAKLEKDINRAFELSDFSYVLMHTIEKDPGRAVYTATLASGQRLSSDEIKKFVEISSGISNSLKYLVPNDQLLQNGCKINAKMHEIAANFMLLDDLENTEAICSAVLEEVVFLAETANYIGLGLLDLGVEIKQNPVGHFVGLLIGPVALPVYIFASALMYGMPCQMVVDSFYDAIDGTGDPRVYEFSVKYQEEAQAAQNEYFALLSAKVQNMTYPEFCRNFGYYAGQAIEAYLASRVEFFCLSKTGVLYTKIGELKDLLTKEKALAGARNVVAPTQRGLDNISDGMKTIFEKGKSDLLKVLGVLEKNPELIELEGSVEGAVARIMGDMEEMGPATTEELARFMKNESGVEREMLENKFTTDPHNINAQTNLASKLQELESAQKSAVRMETLPDGRIRYYEQVTPGLVAQKVGNTYSANSLIGLCSVLEQAKADQRILLVSYGSGSGCDAFIFKTTKLVEKKDSSILSLKNYLDQKIYLSYPEYRKNIDSIG